MDLPRKNLYSVGEVAKVLSEETGCTVYSRDIIDYARGKLGETAAWLEAGTEKVWLTSEQIERFSIAWGADHNLETSKEFLAKTIDTLDKAARNRKALANNSKRPGLSL